MKQTIKNAFLGILTFIGFALGAQETISGTIIDGNGVPLPGATIVVVETNDGTTTDFDGNYSINASEGQTIILSYVGYETLKLKVSDNTNFDISLKQSGALDEIVVTALGISREKKSLGYAVTEVAGDNVNTIKDNNLANSLSGKVAGLQVSQSGSLGSGSRVTIRGNN